MRIALVHYSAPPVIGGVEIVVGAHARLLRRAGHDVRVLAGRGDADVVPELDSRHPEAEAVAAGLAAGRLDARYAELREGLRRRLLPLLADRDVVVPHNVLTMPFNLPAAEALLAAGRPLVAWTHDLAWINPRYESYRRDRPPWNLLGRAQPGVRYVAVSRTRARELASAFGLPPRAVSVVPNGVEAGRFLGIDGGTARLARRAGLLDADPLLLCPSRISPRKRLELALEAVALLAREEPALKLAISGPLGAHSAENRAYAAELQSAAARLGLQHKVIFMHQLMGSQGAHPVGDAEIAGLYRLADAVVLPSEGEGFGLPLLEAGLARAPVVCADIPVLREVAGGSACFFAPDGGPAAMAAATRRALATRPARLRRRARRQDWSAIAPRLEAVLAEAAGG